MAVTLKDVAEAADVSLSTASRALRGSPLISAETRATVEAAAAGLGYRINRAASALRSNRSQLVGLVLNNLVNASFHTIAEVVQKRLASDGYQLILGTTDADPGVERRLLETLADHGVDGVIIIGTGQNADLSNGFLADGIAVVNVIRSSKDSAAPTVLAGDRDGAFDATDYFLSQGHRVIGYIGGPESADSGRDRFAGYADALKEAGIEVDERLVVRGPFTQEFGAEAIQTLLDRAPDMTALFAANHESVFGMLPGLTSRGIRIPDDLSLICYEDIPWLEMWHPPITVVDNGSRQLAELAVDLLMQQINNRGSELGGDRIRRTYRVGAQLVHRASSRPLGD
ncbi:LacI family DNA-binding transcriptional regulator [Gryllotalpicola koreensis]|uniref:LacI family DNA-binding transcriptional regulator n=1 Tax=Gryllotalpicola koreensis TaxID=993086 RepID=A0ABP7ZTJ4_9MICO